MPVALVETLLGPARSPLPDGVAYESVMRRLAAWIAGGDRRDEVRVASRYAAAEVAGQWRTGHAAPASMLRDTRAAYAEAEAVAGPLSTWPRPPFVGVAAPDHVRLGKYDGLHATED